MSEPAILEQVSIGELNAATYNPRRITPQAMAKLKASLTTFGMVDPIIANREGSVVVGGHQRLVAAKELGWDKVTVAWGGPWDTETEQALNVALNNREMQGEFDVTKLVAVLDEIKNKEQALFFAAGFEDYQLERFRRQVERQREKPVYPLAQKLMEHYDYVVIFTSTETDFVHLRQILGVETEKSYKKERRGHGRVIMFERFLEKWEGRWQGAGAATADADDIEVDSVGDEQDEGPGGPGDAGEVPEAPRDGD